jgi:uncharacterized membrane protein YfcA
MEIVAFVLLGIVAGFFAGLMGIGGGIITVPVMSLLILPYLDFPSEVIMHIAIASSLAAILPTSIMSTYGHHRQGGIVWPIAMKMTPGLLLGAGLGAFFASNLTHYVLQLTFALFLIFVSIYMFFSPADLIKPGAKRMSNFPYISLLIGALSAVLGVGGGTMTVPYLLWRGTEIHQAIGISAYCGLPIAISSTVVFYFMQSTSDSSLSFEFVYLPAVLGISTGSIIFAPVGAKFTACMPVRKVKILFSLVLLASSAQLLGLKL